VLGRSPLRTPRRNRIGTGAGARSDLRPVPGRGRSR
jgi:hypothetical protein